MMTNDLALRAPMTRLRRMTDGCGLSFVMSCAALVICHFP
jgi:hypothetical protein